MNYFLNKILVNIDFSNLTLSYRNKRKETVSKENRKYFIHAFPLGF